jgi:hypothetical protein
LAGLALSVALSFALAHARPLKRPVSDGFSAPCEPASPAFKAAGESKEVSKLDSASAAEHTTALAGVVRSHRAENLTQTAPLPAPAVFPPLLHRPPPANS